ncbi:tyrosine-type recombinase/integrase [Flavobacterium sp.]|jgi:integrase|uniref:tyrosine-type recombinase/integrase n=1 Tax=Flavobacterium sp. TaxID=239 RepID=UPI0037C04DC1
MKVAFFTIKGKNDTVSIYVRFADSKRFDKKTKTGLSVKFQDWSNAKQKVKLTSANPQKDFINHKLREIEDYILLRYNEDYCTQKFIGNNWLKDQIANFFGRANLNELHKTYFVDWVQKFIDDCKIRLYKGKPIAKRTVQHYQTTIYKLKNYELHFDTKLRFQDIGLDFYRTFLVYCKTIEKLNNNTTGGYVTNIKKWCKEIDIEGLPINQQYRHSEFSTISNKTKDVYLNETEIDQVYKHDFSYSERLDNVRDNFIIGLRTGLRISDFLRLKNFDYVDGKIHIETTKTAHPVVIPLHSQVKEILNKRNGCLPKHIADSNFNKYVKEVCEIVGFTEMIEGAKMINKKDEEDFFTSSKVQIKNKTRKEFGTYPKYELISAHTCRRSFASNLYGNLENLTIMAITGHKTESEFLKYIKITPKENAEKLQAYWDKQIKPSL